jgi:hypothetical protein
VAGNVLIWAPYEIAYSVKQRERRDPAQRRNPDNKQKSRREKDYGQAEPISERSLDATVAGRQHVGPSQCLPWTSLVFAATLPAAKDGPVIYAPGQGSHRLEFSHPRW